MGMPLAQQPARRTRSDRIVGALSKMFARRETCPICTQEFYLGDCAIVKAGILEGPQNLPKLKSLPPTGSWRLLRDRIRPKSLKSQESEHDDERRQCPKCGRALPKNFERARNYIIGVIGDTDSGKTVLLRQLFRDLKRRSVLDALGASHPTLEIPDTSQWGDKANDISQSFSQNQRIPVEKPYVFSMEVEGHGVLGRNRPINLIFYDVPGESTVNPNILRTNFPQALEADALILLADPEMMPHVLPYIPLYARSDQARLHPEELHTKKTHAPDILHNVQDQLINRGRRKWYDRKLRLPVAITVSKSDLLKYSIHSLVTQSADAGQRVRASARVYDFLEDRRYPDPLYRDAFDETSEHVRQFLEDIGESELAGKHRGLAHYRYFAVAATGCPQSSDGRFNNPHPRRVADPVLWILLQLRVIDNNVYVNKETGKRIVRETRDTVRDAAGKFQD